MYIHGSERDDMKNNYNSTDFISINSSPSKRNKPKI